jgi:signal transduction histidine kinase
METATVIWSFSAAAAMTLAVLCGLMWASQRRDYASLALCLLGVATAAAAYVELGMMSSATTDEFSLWLRWYHVPLFLGILAQVLFFHFYLGPSAKALMWAVILARAAILGVNFLVHPNVNFASIDSLRVISLLGDDISTIGAAQPRSEFQWFAVASLLLLMIYAVDTAVRRWRTGGAEARRRALAVLLATALPMLCSVLYTQLLIYGVLRGPVTNLPWFLGTLLMMAYEAGREFIRSRRAQLELAELRGQMAQVDRINLLGQLSSALAHELAQPLTAISANVRAARRNMRHQPLDPAELSATLDDIARDDGRAVEIINRMRQLFKQRDIDLEPVRVEEVVRNAVSLVRAEADSRQVVLRTVLPPGLPRVLGDRVHLSQVLLNLLVNGIHAVQCRPAEDRLIVVEARADAETGKVEIDVRDSGPGIPDGIFDRLFGPLFTTKPEGMGMGLALSRRIIEAHGGKLWADHPAAHTGAVFRFTLKST